ncbi:hypothetical protein ES288_A01G175300v1 [Gossypium darwinii]|uniref:Uncharacterized protein n=1 Tax=Gossypium darwinii TaxID=34276 RepID=A0A5D2HMG7_GOSDA|nr:hypothetical protein ES288_A01G175300v1 [Gossypium darwinii]
MARNDFGVWEIFLPNNQKGSLRIKRVSRLGLSSLYRLLEKFHIREYTMIHHKKFCILFKHPTRLKSP